MVFFAKCKLHYYRRMHSELSEQFWENDVDGERIVWIYEWYWYARRKIHHRQRAYIIHWRHQFCSGVNCLIDQIQLPITIWWKINNYICIPNFEQFNQKIDFRPKLNILHSARWLWGKRFEPRFFQNFFWNFFFIS